MKRRLVKLVVFLLLGAIINVAVAWGIVWLSSHGAWRRHTERYLRIGEETTFIAKGVGYIGVYQDGPGTNSNIGFSNVRVVNDDEYASLVPSSSEFHIGNPAHESRHAVQEFSHIVGCSEMLAGWPTLCVRGSSCHRWSSAHQPLPDVCNSLAHLGEKRPCPYGPIWPGFAINTVFYAAVLWLLFVAPFALRRRLRIKRGLCPKCAYPVGTNTVCTECGAPRAVTPPPPPPPPPPPKEIGA